MDIRRILIAIPVLIRITIAAFFVLAAAPGDPILARMDPGILSRMTDASNQGALQGGMASVASVAAIIGPLFLTQALAFGAERGTTGAAFLSAAILVALALGDIYFGVLRKIAADPAAAQ